MVDVVTQNTRPLRYIVEALGQMVSMVRDFGMPDTAQLLETARREIAASLPRQEGGE